MFIIGKLYGIGVGPGDPELLTIKAKRIINQVDILFCPEKKEGSGSFAYDIIKEHIENTNLTIVYLTYPMNYNEDELKKLWEHNGIIISEMLRGEKTGAFITLGDPTIYSTFMYTMPYIDQEHIDIEVIPGITSFCAIASQLKIPLVAWEENLTIVPVRKKGNEELEKLIMTSDNLVLMKPSNNTEEITKMIKNKELLDNFILMTKAGTDQGVIISDLNELENTKLPYLSTMIIKKSGINFTQPILKEKI